MSKLIQDDEKKQLIHTCICGVEHQITFNDDGVANLRSFAPKKQNLSIEEKNNGENEDGRTDGKKEGKTKKRGFFESLYGTE